MEQTQIDLLILNEIGIVQKETMNEQEGSLITIEQPQERNSYDFIKTEKQIEKEDNIKNTLPRIHFGFFSNIQENRTKYIY